MAIQQRRGAYADFKPNKMTPAEIAVVQSGDPVGVNGQAVYVAFQAGTVKRLATNEDIQAEITSATSEIAADLVSEIESDIAEDVTAAQTAATSASNSAETATQAVATINGTMSSAFVEKTASGGIVTFTDGADSVPMKSVIAHIAPVQNGSGDPSPTNVRAISGWTGVNVYRCAENIAENATFTSGYYNESGNVTSSSSMKHEEDYLPVIRGEKYFICFSGSAGASQRIRVHEYNASQQWLRQIVASDGGANYVSWTASNDAVYVRFSLVSGAVANSIVCAKGDRYSFEFPQSAGTVYGGYVDVTNGKLVVTYKTFTIDENTSFTDRISNQNRIYFALSDMASAYGGVDDGFTVCNILPKAQSVSGATTPSITIGNSNEYCYVNGISAIDASITTAETFKTWLANHNIIFTYRLATPLEYDLTPTEITSLLGYNAIWSDTGDTDVVYKADVGMALDGKSNLIESIITDVETSATATKNYSVSSYLIYNNVLYKVTSAITSGETITPGTNVTATTIMQELLALA